MNNQSNPASTGNDAVSIDINCDVGESTGKQIIGNDQILIPLVTSANIACGAHGGDRQHVTKAVEIAVQHGVRIGAHPSYPDRENFGRQAMDLSPEQLARTLLEQLEFLAEIVDQHGTSIKYVKPHGALYHRCNTDMSVAQVVVETVQAFDRSFLIMGQSGTEFEKACGSTGIHFIREAFADRRYLESGHLMERSQPEAVIIDPTIAASQAVSIALYNKVAINSNQKTEVIGDSICFHGDNPNAAEILRIAREKLTNSGVNVGSGKFL